MDDLMLASESRDILINNNKGRRMRVIIFIALLCLSFGMIASQGKSNVDVSLNQPAPFSENM